MAEWDEEAHPRNEKGQFGSGGESIKSWAGASRAKSSGPATGAAIKAYAGPGEKRSAAQALAEKMGAREVKAEEFHKSFQEAFPPDSEHSAFVSHYTEAELSGMKTYASADGKSGIAVKDHGDGRIEGTALFNNGGPKGGGLAMLSHAIKNAGVNYVECFGPHLPRLYEKLGFEVENTYPFDPAQAPANWNREKFGTPDYITMRLRK